MQQLLPQAEVLFISSAGSRILTLSEITKSLVGEKAFGLCSIPAEWTLPFIVVSSELFAEYRTSDANGKDALVFEWTTKITDVLVKQGFTSESVVWVRSSGVNETIADRGRLHSELTAIAGLKRAFTLCLEKSLSEASSLGEQLCFVVQQAISTVAAKGHLSNERQYAQEARDWLGQHESLVATGSDEYFKIGLRKWRKNSTNIGTIAPLACLARVSISRSLEPAAWWAYSKSLRLHFEWVWDGKTIYIVQADEALHKDGFDPTAQGRELQKHKRQSPSLRCLVPISEAHAKKFHKIANVAIYQKLNLPSCPIFVLNDPEIFESIHKGNISNDLKEDLKALCEYSLVIRTDIETEDLTKRQLLPRTCEVRNAEEAISFLSETINKFHSNNVGEAVAFIFHNFIPAVSSAFAYAAPGSRKVHIECLWGLPEGLYYNSHDKISVDTKKGPLSDASNLQPEKFSIEYKERFKGFCVAPDSTGAWIRMPIGEPYDWRRAIAHEDQIREIAYQSRRIAEEVGHALSIMWFVGVPPRFSSKPTFPWYHEQFLLDPKPNTRRRKTSWDKAFVIQTSADVERLRTEAAQAQSQIKQIRLQPTDQDLLRNKSLLENVGALAKKIDAVIFLEGGTLSHAYYQLLQTKAQVDIAYPFDFSEEAQEFYKLVRDRVPEKIEAGGENTQTVRLQGDDFIEALRIKLVEEATEALDAPDHERLVEELADLEEVIDGILNQLRVKRKELSKIQKEKREKSGGFSEGIMLVATTNPSGVTTSDVDVDLFGDQPSGSSVVSYATNSRQKQITRRWEDKREHAESTERILKVEVAITQDAWTTESRELSLLDAGGASVRARISGRRDGAKMQLEISLLSLPTQLDFFK